MTKSKKRTSEGKIKVLVVEDDEDTVEFIVDYISRNFGSGSRGVRSMATAMDLIEEGKYRPDLVIHDCKPLRYDDDEVDSKQAGDDLYAFFVDEELPVVVLSGESEDEGIHWEPYRSDPPIAWFEKPLSRESLPDGTSRLVQIDQAIDCYYEWKAQR